MLPVSKWCPWDMYDLLPVSWAPSRAAALRCAICAGVLGSKRCVQDARFAAGVLRSKRRPRAWMYDSFLLSSAVTGALGLRCAAFSCFCPCVFG